MRRRTAVRVFIMCGAMVGGAVIGQAAVDGSDRSPEQPRPEPTASAKRFTTNGPDDAGAINYIVEDTDDPTAFDHL